MCGIFGYIGYRKNAAELIFKGLKGLEYRGYDSWGITVRSGDKLAIEKHVGKISNIKLSLPESNLGMGHTRWATHGGVTEINAHPHLDCTKEIAVLHNGIIENYQVLKEDLIKKGHKFISQTDTEVAAHLIEEFRKKNDFAIAVMHAFNLLHGLNALVIVDTKSHSLIAVKNGSPLIIGVGKDEYFIASDAVGIIPYTRDVIFLKDNEMAVLGETLSLYQLPKGKSIKPTIERIDWKIDTVEKGKYDHFMLKEIYEQAKIIRNIAENFSDQIADLTEVIEKARGIFFIGAGTAYHACLAGSYLFSTIAKEHVNTAAASEFNYLEDFLNKDSLIIALSQSGETIDVIEPLTRAKKKGATIAGIVNALGSTIYRMSDYKILLGAGPEKAVASTKAYIAKLSIIVMLAYAASGNMTFGRKLLRKVAEEVDRLLRDENIRKYREIAEALAKKEHIYSIGRGLSYASALEAALKIKEVSYIHTEGFAGGELKHGPIALIDIGTPCIVFAPMDQAHDAIISNATEIKARGGVIIGVSPENASIFDYWIEVKDAGVGSLISEIIPMQVIAYQLALIKKLDPDKPRNLAKSVTVK